MMPAILAPRREVMVNDCLIFRQAGCVPAPKISSARFPKSALHRLTRPCRERVRDFRSAALAKPLILRELGL
jgi:hypothetical protein